MFVTYILSYNDVFNIIWDLESVLGMILSPKTDLDISVTFACDWVKPYKTLLRYSFVSELWFRKCLIAIFRYEKYGCEVIVT